MGTEGKENMELENNRTRNAEVEITMKIMESTS